MSAPSKIKEVVVLALVVAVSLLTLGFGEERVAAGKAVDLAALPVTVGKWEMVGTDGTAGAKEAGFLNDVLYRTYRRSDGKTLVLAVAYGADQRKKFNLHLPERCYRASGYQVLSLKDGTLHAPELSVKEMVVADSSSTQQVDYWIVLGGKLVTGELEQRLRHLYYSVFGVAADGVLVRVSSFLSAKDAVEARALEREFIAQLYRSVNQGQRQLLFGRNA